MSGDAIAAVGFDLGDTLCEYAGIPLSWEREYGAALAAVAEQCGVPLSPARLRVGEQLLLRYNTRCTPRPDHQEHAAAHIFGELLAEWAAPPEQLDRCIAVGHRKPHRAGFAALAARLGVSCERMLYVGNEHKDVVGANATGCPSVLLWRAADEPPGWGQAHTIRSLTELPELLGGA